MGFAATRDFVSFLRYERVDPKGTANPAMGAGGESARPHHALMFGISQSGRFVRNFIELGMNKDVSGRRVFDGALAHTAGAGKVFANTTFAEPGRTATQHEDRLYPENWFPFSTATETDPASGRTGSLFRGDGSDPAADRDQHLDGILAEGRLADPHRPRPARRTSSCRRIRAST